MVLKFIAGASSNHDQDLSRALAFVDAAAERGCDAVKFQLLAGHCRLPSEIAPVIARIREGEQADGHGFKEPVAAELPDREWHADPSDGLRPLRHVRATWEPA